jgi:hypothetical protein
MLGRAFDSINARGVQMILVTGVSGALGGLIFTGLSAIDGLISTGLPVPSTSSSGL